MNDYWMIVSFIFLVILFLFMGVWMAFDTTYCVNECSSVGLGLKQVNYLNGLQRVCVCDSETLVVK